MVRGGDKLMANMLLWATIFVFTTSLFRFSYSYGGLARTFAGIDVVLIQQGVKTSNNQIAQYKPYFLEDRIIELVESVFEEDLPPYLFGASYSASFVFSDYLVNVRKLKIYPTKVTISLSSESVVFAYHDRKSFAIANGDAYGR